MGKWIFQDKKITHLYKGSGAIRTHSSVIWLEQECEEGVGREEMAVGHLRDMAAKGWNVGVHMTEVRHLTF